MNIGTLKHAGLGALTAALVPIGLAAAVAIAAAGPAAADSVHAPNGFQQLLETGSAVHQSS